MNAGDQHQQLEYEARRRIRRVRNWEGLYGVAIIHLCISFLFIFLYPILTHGSSALPDFVVDAIFYGLLPLPGVVLWLGERIGLIHGMDEMMVLVILTPVNSVLYGLIVFFVGKRDRRQVL